MAWVGIIGICRGRYDTQLASIDGGEVLVDKPCYSPVVWTLGPVLGSEPTLHPRVSCVAPGLWGPEGAQNYIWGALWPM